MRVDFNIDILKSLLYQNPDKVMAATLQFAKINEWQEQKAKPTFKQLTDLAGYFNIPFGYFFLKEMPVKSYPIPHYRTVNNGAFKPSNVLLETIETLQERQDWVKDSLKDLGAEPLAFAKTFTVKSSITKAAEKLHEILDLPAVWCGNSKWDDAFSLLIERAEKAGIFVVVNGVLGNNTHASLDVNEFRGFVLYDNYAPFIFVNGKDFITGKIFTIVHEIVHILLGVSASFDFDNLMVPNDPIEQFCNAVTAEFLVPQKLLTEKVNEIGLNIEMLARHFRVSRIVIARRLLDINKITKAEFFSAYNSFKTGEIKTVKSSGGDFYNTSPYRISRKFFKLVYNEVKQNKLLYRDAFRLTGLSPKAFDGYVNKHLS
jgi:Zn-dependent peptidase ImmA (M78 family)